LNNNAFFFQGNTLILPPDFSETQIDTEIPVEYSKLFTGADIFTIPEYKTAPAYQPPVDCGPLKENGFITSVYIKPDVALPPGWKSFMVRQVMTMLNADVNFDSSLTRLLRAFHIAQWRDDTQFCGRCGAKNTDAENEIARYCPLCEKLEFPRISPAVITIVLNDNDEILLAHNKIFATRVYSHIAGFNEAGESLEETVRREIFEEVNILVKDVCYIKSQPWPFPNSLMIGFFARYQSGELKPDGIEIEDARWFSRDNLPELPRKGSLSRYLIDCWINDRHFFCKTQ